MHTLATLPLSAQAAIAAAILTAAVFGWRFLVKIGMASNDYLPSTDNELNVWASNFTTLIEATPTTYGLDTPAAVTMRTLYNDFAAALILAINPLTRSKVTVAAKDAEKAAMKSFIRSLAAIVQATISVSNENKIALGLPIHDAAPSPIPTPVTHPILGIAPTGPAIIVRRFADQLTPDSRAKPAGAAFLLVASKVSVTAITDPEELTDTDIVTRAPNYKTFSAGDRGKTVYTAAKWVNAKGEEGPWSAIASTIVP